MNKHLKQVLRSCVTHKKEFQAILIGLAFAYMWQVFACNMGWLAEHETIPTEYLIPNFGIMLVATPMVAWFFFGVLRVKWFNQWLRITLYGLAFAIPFAIISAMVLFIDKVSLWKVPMFWVGNIVISVIALILFKPFIKTIV